MRPSGKRLDRRGVGQILQHVEEGDDEAAAGQDRREQRRRRQVLQALDEIQQDHGYQQHEEVPVHADVEEVVLDDVVEVRRNEDEVDAAEAQLGDAEEDVDQRPETNTNDIQIFKICYVGNKFEFYDQNLVTDLRRCQPIKVKSLVFVTPETQKR